MSGLGIDFLGGGEGKKFRGMREMVFLQFGRRFVHIYSQPFSEERRGDGSDEIC